VYVLAVCFCTLSPRTSQPCLGSGVCVVLGVWACDRNVPSWYCVRSLLVPCLWAHHGCPPSNVSFPQSNAALHNKLRSMRRENDTLASQASHPNLLDLSGASTPGTSLDTPGTARRLSLGSTGSPTAFSRAVTGAQSLRHPLASPTDQGAGARSPHDDSSPGSATSPVFDSAVSSGYPASNGRAHTDGPSDDDDGGGGGGGGGGGSSPHASQSRQATSPGPSATNTAPPSTPFSRAYLARASTPVQMRVAEARAAHQAAVASASALEKELEAARAALKTAQEDTAAARRDAARVKRDAEAASAEAVMESAALRLHIEELHEQLAETRAMRGVGGDGGASYAGSFTGGGGGGGGGGVGSSPRNASRRRRHSLVARRPDRAAPPEMSPRTPGVRRRSSLSSTTSLFGDTPSLSLVSPTSAGGGGGGGATASSDNGGTPAGDTTASEQVLELETEVAMLTVQLEQQERLLKAHGVDVSALHAAAQGHPPADGYVPTPPRFAAMRDQLAAARVAAREADEERAAAAEHADELEERLAGAVRQLSQTQAALAACQRETVVVGPARAGGAEQGSALPQPLSVESGQTSGAAGGGGGMGGEGHEHDGTSTPSGVDDGAEGTTGDTVTGAAAPQERHRVEVAALERRLAVSQAAALRAQEEAATAHAAVSRLEARLADAKAAVSTAATARDAAEQAARVLQQRVDASSAAAEAAEARARAALEASAASESKARAANTRSSEAEAAGKAVADLAKAKTASAEAAAAALDKEVQALRSDVRLAQQRLRQAEARCTAAEASTQQARTELGVAKSGGARLQSEVEKQRALVHELQREVERERARHAAVEEACNELRAREQGWANRITELETAAHTTADVDQATSSEPKDSDKAALSASASVVAHLRSQLQQAQQASTASEQRLAVVTDRLTQAEHDRDTARAEATRTTEEAALEIQAAHAANEAAEALVSKWAAERDELGTSLETERARYTLELGALRDELSQCTCGHKQQQQQQQQQQQPKQTEQRLSPITTVPIVTTPGSSNAVGGGDSDGAARIGRAPVSPSDRGVSTTPMDGDTGAGAGVGPVMLQLVASVEAQRALQAVIRGFERGLTALGGEDSGHLAAVSVRLQALNHRGGAHSSPADEGGVAPGPAGADGTMTADSGGRDALNDGEGSSRADGARVATSAGDDGFWRRKCEGYKRELVEAYVELCGRRCGDVCR